MILFKIATITFNMQSTTDPAYICVKTYLVVGKDLTPYLLWFSRCISFLFCNTAAYFSTYSQVLHSGVSLSYWESIVTQSSSLNVEYPYGSFLLLRHLLFHLWLSFHLWQKRDEWPSPSRRSVIWVCAF